MWTQNLKEVIVFIPPSAKDAEDVSAVEGFVNNILTGSSGAPEFRALWRNDERSFEKKLGVFEAPNFNGAIIQDLGIGSDRYPLTVYFEGIDHDIEADRFYKALQTERGPWLIDHPVKGKLLLQLVSVTENIAPVDNGNYTEFSTEWLRPLPLLTIKSKQGLFDTVASAVNAVEAAVVRLQQARSDAYAEIQSAVNTYNRVIGFFDSIASELAATDAILLDAYNSARATFTGAIDALDFTAPDYTPINEAVVDVFEVPSEIEDFPQVASTYERSLDAIIALENPTIDAAATKEFSIILILLSIFRATLVGSFNSRVEIISAIEKITAIYQKALTALDAMQTEYSTGRIDEQYFPQTENYQDVYNLFANDIRFLLTQFLGLRAEHKFVLKNARSPLEITVTEYGDIESYDLFLTSNKLSGNDILLLPAGREVLVYVG
jgi:hypothetical protein